jgi:hypothetical protein
MESGDVFYSRFYRNRVTYLSRRMYAALRPHRRRNERLDGDAARFLRSHRGGRGKRVTDAARVLLDKKTQAKALDQLVSELFVTVIRRDERSVRTGARFIMGLPSDGKKSVRRADCPLKPARRSGCSAAWLPGTGFKSY